MRRALCTGVRDQTTRWPPELARPKRFYDSRLFRLSPQSGIPLCCNNSADLLFKGVIAVAGRKIRRDHSIIPPRSAHHPTRCSRAHRWPAHIVAAITPMAGAVVLLPGTAAPPVCRMFDSVSLSVEAGRGLSEENAMPEQGKPARPSLVVWCVLNGETSQELKCQAAMPST